MSFLDILVEVKAQTVEIPIKGSAGLFSTKFGDKDKKYRVLKVYQIISRNSTKDVRQFRYNPKTKKLFIETKLNYFGSIRFLVRYIEII